MGQIRDLVRSLRAGQLPPGTKVPAPILEKARLGQLSAGELHDLRELMKSPALADQFSPDLRASLETFQRGTPAVKPVTDLIPDLGRVQDPREVPQRFAADFMVLREQLLNRNLTDDQKADRAFDFLTRYAERFVALASGEARGGEGEREHPFLSDKASQVAEEAEAAPQELAPVEEGGEAPPAQEGEAPRGRRRVEGAELPDEVFSEDPPPEEGARAARNEAQRTADGRRPLSREEQVREAKKFATLADGVGFRELADPRTGKTGTELVYDLAQAQTLRELKQQLAQVHVKSNAARTGDEAPPQPQQHELAAGQPLTRQARERGEAAATAAANDRRVELERVQNRDGAMRVQPWAAEAGKVLVAPLDRSQRSFDGESASSDRHGGTNKRLGRNMVWNLLHRFRGREQEESALAKDMWDKIAVGAILFLFGLAMVAVILISL